MNYAKLSEWEMDGVELLVQFGTPREEAARIMKWSRKEAERKAREAEDRAQFVMDFRTLGSRVLAERDGKSQQAIRNRFNDIISKESLKDCLAPDLRAA